MRLPFLLRGLAAALMLGAAIVGQAAAPGAGDAAPNYLGRTLERDVLHLDNYAGKPVVISFWATWCHYCLKELPILSSIRSASKGEVAVIAVNTEDRDTFRKVKALLHELDLDLAYDPDHRAQDEYGVSTLPHMLVIGRDGKIVQVFHGYDESALPGIVDAINRATGAAR